MINIKNSALLRVLAFGMTLLILVGMFPTAVVTAYSGESDKAAKIGAQEYDSVTEAIAAATSGSNCVAPETATEIILLKDVSEGFDIGKSNGSETKNVILNLNGHTLTLKPAVGSVGTVTNGIRVLAYSKLVVKNGTVICPDDMASNIKTGIANYSELVLDNVTVRSGALTKYTVNNRGRLTLSGDTSVENGKVEQTNGKGDYIAITNDPYNLYYIENVDATLICDSKDVSVGTVQVERYARTSNNKGQVKLDISAGYFDRITEDGQTSVTVSYDITGGTIGVYSDEELKNTIAMAEPGSEYSCPENAVTVKLMGMGVFNHGFDVGTSNGKAPKNIVLDLNGKELVLNPAVGSVGTVSNGIRVLAHSKLVIKNGTLRCPDETSANIKTGIANYSELTLESVTVKSGALTRYTVNNRGKLILSGNTTVENGKTAPDDYSDTMGMLFAITNDPYTLYGTANGNNASLICKSENVTVGNIQNECYENVDKKIIFDISKGKFGKFVKPNVGGRVTVDGIGIIGGVFESNISEYIDTLNYGLIYDGEAGTYTVNKLNNVTDFVFETQQPLDQWVGAAYTNTAKTQMPNAGNVTYEIVSGTDIATVNASTGEVIFKGLGTVTVKATLAANEFYKSATAEYTVTSVKKNQDEFKFDISAPSITYNPEKLLFSNTATGGSGIGSVTYEIEGDSECATINSATGKITVIKAGTVTIKATKAADGRYNETTAKYVLTVKHADQEALHFNDTTAEIIYSGNAQNVLQVSGGSGSGKLKYSIVSGDEYATIDSDTGAITTLKAGTVTVKVEKAGDDCYNAAMPITKEIIVERAEQTGFVFAKTDSEYLNITYNDNGNVFSNTASGGQTSEEPAYEIISGADVADIDPVTGKLTVKKSGVITVKAVKGGNDCYKSVDAKYVLTVNPGSPEFTAEDVNLIYGKSEYQITVNTTVGGTGAYSYSIDTNNIGATVDENTGKITFANSTGKVGSVAVMVKKAADDCYSELEKTFTLTVSYLTAAAQPSVEGMSKNESGWYTGSVTVKAPLGYSVSYSNDLNGNTWSDSVAVTEDGVNNKKVYLKNEDGITDAISLNGIKLDTVAPSNLKITTAETFVEKILNRITFGIYQSDNVTVTLEANDVTSGIDHLTYNIGNGNMTVNADELIINESGTAKYTFTVSAQYRNKISFSATDTAGWTSSQIDSEHTLVIDTVNPKLDVGYVFDGENNLGDTIYTNGDVTVKFSIKEDNFDIRLSDPVFKVGDLTVRLDWTKDSVTGTWIAEQVLSNEGIYNLSLNFADASGNAMVGKNNTVQFSQTVVVDKTKPVISSNYGTAAPIKDNIYKNGRTATFTVTESNFNAENVNFTVTAKDINGAIVDISSKEYSKYIKNSANWHTNGNVHTVSLPIFDIDALYSVDIEYKDLAGNSAEEYSADEFVVDKTSASEIRVDYSTPIIKRVLETVTFGFYKANVNVTVTAEDAVSGVDYFVISYNQANGKNNSNKASYSTEKLTAIQSAEDKSKFTASHTISANARGTVSVKAVDNATNDSSKSDAFVVVADTITPGLDYEWKFTNDQVREYNNIYYTNGEAKVKFTVTEANFDLSEKPIFTVNGDVKEISWTQIEGTDKWFGEYSISENGDYTVELSYADCSDNAMDSYSKVVHIDKVAPAFDVTYDNDNAWNTNNYKADRTATVKVTEHNFKADEVELIVTAENIVGAVDISRKEYSDYAKNPTNWLYKDSEGNYVSDPSQAVNSDEHYLVLPKFDIDAAYSVELDYTDLANNAATSYVDEFTIDRKAPVNLNIEYSASIVDKIIETVTFGFYKSKVTVTVNAEDITSGVDYVDWAYAKEEGTSLKNHGALGGRITSENIAYSDNGLVATVTFDVPANVRGYISATVTDKAGNVSSKSDKDRISVVVDNIAPVISVEYKAINADTSVRFTDDRLVNVSNFADASNVYYNGNITAKIVVNEANFFEGVETADKVIHNIGIKLTETDNNGSKTVYEYLPYGSTQKYTEAIPKYVNWNASGDNHSFTISYEKDADYFLEIEYSDFSDNAADISENDGITETQMYRPKTVTVDKTAPVVCIEYGNKNIIHTVAGRDYYNDEQTATVTVTEHNFRADDFAADIKAVDAECNLVTVEDFKAMLSDDAKWTRNGDVYTISVKYSADANYTFDYSYKDLAQNAAAAYSGDKFTVDKTAPENLTVAYSRSIVDRILETVTFGYYNSKVTVTVSAEDDISGIHRFEYSYIKSIGVSSVNSELLNNSVQEKDFTVDGKKSTARFDIPKDTLKNDNQFNGTVKFVAFDRSENHTEKSDTRRVIVDNIAPTATITYNEPVQKANDISYYAGNINAKIVINEANFYSEDVVVKVNGKDASVKWSDDSVDVHTGTFALAEDGDYVVTVEYKDRSANEMTKYTSNCLTLDTKAPSVTVSNIKINSANKSDKYGFTITANDINIDASSFKPMLTATVRKEDGSYGTENISLGQMQTVEDGKTYAFTVDNLAADAVYSLVCTLKDMSGNTYSKLALSDGKEYEEVQFSINRNGSAFAVDKSTETLIDNYYVYGVNDDVVIEEVNVDPIETYSVKVNGEVLTEGKDYTSVLSDKSGEWSKRTYIISKELFAAEGEYSIVIESTDKADTTSYSDVKDLSVTFVVDKTAPVLTISGLTNGGRYQVEEQIVTVIPTDDGGRLYGMKVVVLDSDGKPVTNFEGKDISLRFEMFGEEFITYLAENGGKLSFTVPEGLENQVKIICNDCAVGADGKTNETTEVFTKVTVSQSGWIIFYANKPLFYASIAGIAVIFGGSLSLIVIKKRKK